MRDPSGKWRERLRFTLLLLVFAVLAHGFFGWFRGWLKPADPYREPTGHAEKVFRAGEGGHPATSPGDRLRLFFWLGE